MTTIAVKDGVIAFDSRRTRDGRIIISDNEDKSIRFEKDGKECVAVAAGSIPDVNTLISIYTGKISESDCNSDNLQAEAFVMENEDGKPKVIHIWFSCGSLLKQTPCDKGDAIGSGSDFALAAFDHGATAVKAVKAAKKRDVYTGGVVRSVRLKNIAE